jgi:hypothetical protein
LPFADRATAVGRGVVHRRAPLILTTEFLGLPTPTPWPINAIAANSLSLGWLDDRFREKIVTLADKLLGLLALGWMELLS